MQGRVVEQEVRNLKKEKTSRKASKWKYFSIVKIFSFRELALVINVLRMNKTLCIWPDLVQLSGKANG